MLENFSFDKKNTAIIVALKLPDATAEEVVASVEELELLAKTLGFITDKIFIQNRTHIESDFFIGKGKVDEIKNYISQKKSMRFCSTMNLPVFRKEILKNI